MSSLERCGQLSTAEHFITKASGASHKQEGELCQARGKGVFTTILLHKWLYDPELPHHPGQCQRESYIISFRVANLHLFMHLPNTDFNKPWTSLGLGISPVVTGLLIAFQVSLFLVWSLIALMCPSLCWIISKGLITCCWAKPIKSISFLSKTLSNLRDANGRN